MWSLTSPRKEHDVGDKTKILDRDGFLNRAVIREVPLSDGSSVCIRALPASAIVAGAQDAASAFEPANLLVQSLCDANGKLLFAQGDTSGVMAVDHLALKTILDAILDLNGLRAQGAPEKN
jgi:hypothetical protein